MPPIGKVKMQKTHSVVYGQLPPPQELPKISLSTKIPTAITIKGRKAKKIGARRAIGIIQEACFLFLNRMGIISLSLFLSS